MFTLIDTSTEVAQHVEVIVDRARPDAATTQIGDHSLAEAVQKRAAEEDRDARASRVSVDVGHVRALDIRRVHAEGSRFRIALDFYAVHAKKLAHNPHVADVRDTREEAFGLTEKRGNHGLRDQVLCTANGDLTLERLPAAHIEA